jgi:hypothetical protein
MEMNKRVKRLQKSARNPKTVRFETLDGILADAGFERRQPSSGSSHFIYTKGSTQITVPYKRPFVKETYVKRVLELIETKL